MNKQIYVNLPVKDLDRSIRFFTALGYTFNPDFSDENATCMIISDNIFVMLLKEAFFRNFIHQDIADATKVTEVIVSLSVDTREDVDTMVAKAVKAGATAPNAKQDHGFMYVHGFQDPDGHLWEFTYMNMSEAPQG